MASAPIPSALLGALTGQSSAPSGPPADQIPQDQQEDPDIYEMEGKVLGSPVRIKIEGSTRMLSKQALQQAVPFLFQFLAQGPLVQQLAAQGKAVEFGELFRMLEDAAGTSLSYNLVRPLSQQEQQRLAQPPPQAQMEMQKAQLDAQTRIQMGQMKAQTEQMRTQVDARLRELEMEENSARELIRTIQDERASLADVETNRQTKMIDAQAQAQKARQDLAHREAKNRLDRESAKLKHQADMAKVISTLAQARAQQQTAEMSPDEEGPTVE